MYVRVKSTAAGPWGNILAGKIGPVPDAVGRAMIAARQAVEVDGPTVRPAIPETATAEPEQEQAVMGPATRRRRRHAEVQGLQT